MLSNDLAFTARCSAPGLCFLSEDLVSGVFEGLCFGKEGKSLLNHRIPVGHDAQTLELTKLARKNLLFDADLQPVRDSIQIGFGPRNVLAREVLFELAHDRVVHLEILVDGAVGEVMGGEVEEDALSGIRQYILEVVALGAVDLLVWRDAAAAVDRAAGVGQLHFAVGRVGALAPA